MPWSVSMLEEFETCPRRCHAVRIAREWQDESPVLEKGKAVHTALERRAVAGERLPPEHAYLEPFFRALADLPGARVHAERRIALTDELVETEWTSRDVWVRVAIDLAVIKGSAALVLDWKTGKRRVDTGQVELGALCLMAVEPEVDEVHATYVWLASCEMDPPKVVRRDDAERLWRRWRSRVVPLMQAWSSGIWPARPSGLCRAWCPVLSCEFNGRRGREIELKELVDDEVDE